jgi:E3 ubiquitin-protein ligase SHPRH
VYKFTHSSKVPRFNRWNLLSAAKTASKFAFQISTCTATAWWSRVIDAAAASGGAGLLDRVLDNLLNGHWQGREVAFTDLSGLRFQLETELAKMGEERGKFLDRMAHLARVTAAAAPEDVSAAGKCDMCFDRNVFKADGSLGARTQEHQHQTQRERNEARLAAQAQVMCQHCAAGPLITSYEDILFGKQVSDANLYGGRRAAEDVDVGAGRSAPCSAEMVLKFLSTRLPKSGLAAAAAAEAAAAHLEALEEMRREFTRAMVLQKHQRDELQAQDELVMATTRIRVRLPHEVGRYSR